MSTGAAAVVSKFTPASPAAAVRGQAAGANAKLCSDISCVTPVDAGAALYRLRAWLACSSIAASRECPVRSAMAGKLSLLLEMIGINRGNGESSSSRMAAFRRIPLVAAEP